MRKIERMNETLRTLYGIELSESSVENLIFVHRNYMDRRAEILRHGTLQEANLNPEYVKAVMISETANMILREIAPRRTRRRKKSK